MADATVRHPPNAVRIKISEERNGVRRDPKLPLGQSAFEGNYDVQHCLRMKTVFRFIQNDDLTGQFMSLRTQRDTELQNDALTVGQVGLPPMETRKS